MKNRWPLRLVLASLLLAGCVSSKSGQAAAAPNFQLKDLQGHPVALSDFKGHPVLLDFWATWCGPCRMSIPLVEKFYQKHKTEGLQVLGINVDEDTSSVPDFVRQFGMSYPVLLGGSSDVSMAYRVEGIPTFIFIDPEGRIIQHFEGFGFEIPDAWEAEFQRLKVAAAR